MPVTTTGDKSSLISLNLGMPPFSTKFYAADSASHYMVFASGDAGEKLKCMTLIEKEISKVILIRRSKTGKLHPSLGINSSGSKLEVETV